MTIRNALPSDAFALSRLNDAFNGEGCNSLDAIEDSLRANPQEIVCVAEEGGALVGFCCGQVFRSICYDMGYGEITELFVLEAYRRQGIGRRLMAHMEGELKKAGCGDLQLFTGKDNEKAQAFYKALGYAPSEEMMFRKR